MTFHPTLSSPPTSSATRQSGGDRSGLLRVQGGLVPLSLDFDAAWLGQCLTAGWEPTSCRRCPRDLCKLTFRFFPQQRNIAKVASQVHAFQENPYTFAPDPKLQSHLKQRIARFSGADISILAEDSRAGAHQVASEKHSKKIQDKLRRMKATFQ